MSTCEQIITNAYAKSAAARPETIAATPELTARIGQCLREMFHLLGRENPYLIGVSSAVNFNGVGWPRPSNALGVLNVFADAGTIVTPAMVIGADINIVPYDDRAFCAGLPSLTELGQQLVPTGQAMDPSAGTIVLVYSRAPTMPVLATDLIDPLFPEAFDDLLQFDLAAYLATKDQRAEDESTFLGFKNALVQQLIDWARTPTYVLQQRFPAVTPPLTNTDGGRQAPESR